MSRSNYKIFGILFAFVPTDSRHFTYFPSLFHISKSFRSAVVGVDLLSLDGRLAVRCLEGDEDVEEVQRFLQTVKEDYEAPVGGSFFVGVICGGAVSPSWMDIVLSMLKVLYDIRFQPPSSDNENIIWLECGWKPNNLNV